jgi:hypothetical protein
MPRSVAVSMVPRSASAATALFLLLGLMLFGCFFGFDFLAEFFVFGVFGFAAFAFVVDFFDRGRFVFALIVGFAVVRFGFAFFLGDGERPRRGGGQADRVRRGGSGEQQQ